jgi:tyrosyl-tRNA synthetase
MTAPSAGARPEVPAALFRGVVDLKTKEDLFRKLASGRPLRVKFGIDPTSRDIHVGHAVPLRKLRQFQDLGHQAVLIVGDYTALVGDPSGRNATRPLLTEAEVRANAATYLEQIGKILDLSRLEVRWNSEWFSKLAFLDVIRLAAKLTVARILERDDFEKRIEAKTPIGLHELLYPLMQGYDSVMVRADVEIGATEQLFNLLVGRELQPDFGQEPQVCLTLPILVGTDGTRKMSKSYGNYVGISEPPEEQYGKTMSIPDRAMRDWFTLCTAVPEDEIEALLAGHPMEAKRRLAREIVRTYHGENEAERAAEHFQKTVVEKEVPPELREHAVSPEELAGGRAWIVALLRGAFSFSGSEARRLVAQGAVSLDGEPVRDVDAKVAVKDGAILKAGKRNFVRLRLGGADRESG